jgi:two-component system, chemotaxis family, chemotaxis protein CheY
MTILVVDDEPEYRLVTKTVLLGEGFKVELAENGEEGMKKLHDADFDIIVSDIYMPVMDGIRFHHAVRAHPKFEKLPFLFVSAFDDQHTLDAVQDPRYDGFLRKARPTEELVEWIRYLTTPEGSRSKLPPGGARSNLTNRQRTGFRGGPFI